MAHGIHITTADGSRVWVEVAGGRLAARGYQPGAEEPESLWLGAADGEVA